jgi:uncharacterized membrane protein
MRALIRDSVFIIILVLTLVCFALILVRDLLTHHSKYPFRFFNLVLSWGPLVISLFLAAILDIKRRFFRIGAFILLGLLWLVLYPNAAYLVTDYVHVFANPKYDSMPFGNVYLWYDLVFFFLYALCGLLLGYLSLRYVHLAIQNKLPPALCWLFVVGVSYLAAFGVYIGRIKRLNSWDVFNLSGLVEQVSDLFTFATVQFVGIFGTFLVFVYWLFYLLTKPSRLQES